MLVHVYSGLMSRCNVLAHAYALMNKSGDKELTAVWPLEKGCHISFYDVFSKDIFSDINFKVIEYEDFRPTDLKKIGLNIPKLYKEFSDRKQYSTFKKQFDAAMFDKEYIDYAPPKEIGWEGEIFAEFFRECWQKTKKTIEDKGTQNLAVHVYSDIIVDEEYIEIDHSCLKFRDEYTEKAREIIGEQNDRIIGLHIRRTDHTVAKQNSTDEDFIKAIDEEIKTNPGISFYLSTDDTDVENNLKTQYGDKIIIQPDKTWGRDDSEAIKSGIIDMLCLSMCNKIYGSYKSRFSLVAARYGKLPLIIMRDTDKE